METLLERLQSTKQMRNSVTTGRVMRHVLHANICRVLMVVEPAAKGTLLPWGAAKGTLLPLGAHCEASLVSRTGGVSQSSLLAFPDRTSGGAGLRAVEAWLIRQPGGSSRASRHHLA